ncbi:MULTISPECIES: response regulator transcription factor [Pseudobutyrivibrio]|uniref:Stage 0 sporulation protein A homolog n=1 Tax=Pseudobutyrivibrio xylanivorans TaxID=185007 RepID=A0A1G5RVK7_PSEXY|nr:MULTISPECIES: response regulator transcription factor [Pseudobutyrivibrio]MDC7278536.1 response regulator transcription factor [Butyrivibrio fibrisolvens]SCZ77760.1 DNA-binding response regulator, OmpR family, contains REC and winged-helix (wHTH) domain [Pseudobutyrivibrio xylanivorans]
MNKQKILTVDDNEEIRNIIKILLESEGYEVLEAMNGEAALAMVDDSIDLIILDIMMPGKSGLDVCKIIREKYQMPILFLTAKGTDSDKSLGLLIGGDDYLSKPFSHAELTARVKSLLRRYYVYKGKEAPVDDNFLTYDVFKVAKDRNEVYATNSTGEEIQLDLSELEYQIFKLLIGSPGRIFPAQLIYESIWNEPYFYSSNATIMVHIRNLRTKIEEDPSNPRHLLTVWGKGYKLQ